MATGRLYHSAPIAGVAATTAIQFFYLAAPTDAVVYLEEVNITQDTSETSEQLVLRLFRTTTDGSASGTANTPAPQNVGDPAFGGSCRTMLAAATLTATTTYMREGQNVLNGWCWKGSYEDPLIVLSPTAGTAGRIGIELVNAPGASTTFSGFIRFREIGG